jgi:hypothetical protein
MHTSWLSTIMHLAWIVFNKLLDSWRVLSLVVGLEVINVY